MTSFKREFQIAREPKLSSHLILYLYDSLLEIRPGRDGQHGFDFCHRDRHRPLTALHILHVGNQVGPGSIQRSLDKGRFLLEGVHRGVGVAGQRVVDRGVAPLRTQAA